MFNKPITSNQIDKLIQGQKVKLPKHIPGEEFLKGPIPRLWLYKASLLKGKALAVGLALWFQGGLTKCGLVRLSGKVLQKFGVNRQAGYRGLAALEKAGLVTVVRHPGRCSMVTILGRPRDTHS